MRIGVLAAVLAAALLGGGEAWAQGVAPPECSTTSAEGAALTVYPDLPLYTAQFGEEKVPGAALPFRTRVNILPGPRRGERVLVKVTDGSQCGYVQSSKILSGAPLKVIDIDADEQVRVSIFGVVRNNWTIKAMLRSNPKLDKIAHEAQLFQEPGGEIPFRASRVFSLFNVFKVEKRGSDPDDWWYFVGGKKVADDKVLSGWVRGGNLFLWGSGVAVYSAGDKSAPFDVFTDVETLKKGAKEGLLATRSNLEPPDDRDIAKFPILDQIFRNANADRKSGVPPIAYEIGFFGEGCLRAKGCEGATESEKFGSAQIGDHLSKIGEIVRTVGQIDVMFVIDNTESMTQYFAPIARAVSRWAKATSAKQRGRVRFGAVVYGDYRDRHRPSKENMDYRLVAQLDPDTAKLERALMSASAATFSDAIGDQPEAGYAALVRAAQEGFWAADSGYRLLFWIGDQGVQREPSKLPLDPVSAGDVQQELRDKKLYLIPINVTGSRPEVSSFMRDAERLLDESKLALGVKAVRTFEKGGGSARQEPEIAAQRVTELLDAALFYSKAVPEWIQAQRGKNVDGAPKQVDDKVSLTPKTSDLPITQLVDVSALKDGPFLRLGLTPEEVERVLNLKQLMTKGYVSYDTGKRNIAFFAAMEPARFSLFQGSLAELCRAMSEDDDLRNRTLGLMLTLAHNLGGDPYNPTETIAEYLDRIIFIPKRHFASWLDKSANEFANEWASATGEHKTRLKLSACRSAYLLQQMGAGQKVESIDDLDFDAALGKVQLKPGRSLRSYSWLWSTESKIEYYFVPAEYLPKDS
jgi:hypothetical protein